MNEKIIWQCFCILSQMFCVPLRTQFAFTRKEQKHKLRNFYTKLQIALWSLFDENTNCKCPPSWFWVEIDDNAIQEVVWDAYKRFDLSSAKCCCPASSKMWTWLNLHIVGVLKIGLISVYRCVAKCKFDTQFAIQSTKIHKVAKCKFLEIESKVKYFNGWHTW